MCLANNIFNGTKFAVNLANDRQHFYSLDGHLDFHVADKFTVESFHHPLIIIYDFRQRRAKLAEHRVGWVSRPRVLSGFVIDRVEPAHRFVLWRSN